MRIAIHATPALDVGTGIGTYTEQLIRNLLPLLDEDGLSLYHDSVRRGGLPLMAYGVPVYRGAFVVRVAVRAPLVGALLPGEWIAGACDVVHGLNYFTPSVRHARRVATIHDLTALRFPQWHTPAVQRYAARLRRTASRHDLLIADSKATMEDIVTLLGVPSERIRVVPLAAGPGFVPQEGGTVDRVLGSLGIRRPYLLHVGSLEPRKNLVRLLQAFERSQARDSHDLLLIGATGWRNDNIFALAERLAPRVRILSGVAAADLPAVYAGATALVYPSLWEGFGLPPLEAMACGTPVACSATSSLPEVVGDAAVTFDPLDKVAIAHAMDLLVGDSALRQALAAAGLERASLFSWERTAAATLAAYLELA